MPTPFEIESRDARRMRNLVRVEGRLRQALEGTRGRRFDIDTMITLQLRVEDMLDTLGLLGLDDEFWARLSSGGVMPPSADDRAALTQLDGEAFAYLLEAVGYTSPPPPEAHDLVDDTVDALINVLGERLLADELEERVAAARFNLMTLVQRARRQIQPLGPPEAHASMVRSTARVVGRAARWLIPPAIGVAGGATVEMIAPGTGVGFITGKSLASITETLAASGSALVASRLGNVSDTDQAIPLEKQWDAINPWLIHAAAINDLIEGGRDRLSQYDPERFADARQLAAKAEEHLRRLSVLRADWTDLFSSAAAERLAAWRSKLNSLRFDIANAEQAASAEAARSATQSGDVIGAHKKQEQSQPPKTQTRYLGY